MSASDATSYVNVTWIKATVPVRGPVGIGIDYNVYNSRHEYKSLPRIDSRNPEIRLSMAWRLY